jgi:hypothetical protein
MDIPPFELLVSREFLPKNQFFPDPFHKTLKGLGKKDDKFAKPPCIILGIPDASAALQAA